METRLVSVTPTISTSAYTAGDQFGDLQTLSQILHSYENTSGKLTSVSVIDKESNNPDLDLLFFDESPTIVSSDNAALDISDAELVDKFIGSVSVAASDYISLVGASMASVDELEHVMKSVNTKGDLFVLALINSAPTYTLTDAVTLKLGFAGE